jgi:hypothetical protein
MPVPSGKDAAELPALPCTKSTGVPMWQTGQNDGGNGFGLAWLYPNFAKMMEKHRDVPLPCLIARG